MVIDMVGGRYRLLIIHMQGFRRAEAFIVFVRDRYRTIICACPTGGAELFLYIAGKSADLYGEVPQFTLDRQ